MQAQLERQVFDEGSSGPVREGMFYPLSHLFLPILGIINMFPLRRKGCIKQKQIPKESLNNTEFLD